MKHLLAVNTPDGQDGFAIPALWQPFLEELVDRALMIHETYLTTNEACLGKEIPGQSPPSILSEEYISSRICCGLPKIRHRPKYECDTALEDDNEDIEKDKPGCKHAFHKPGARTGGVFTCMCQHGVAYASFII